MNALQDLQRAAQKLNPVQQAYAHDLQPAPQPAPRRPQPNVLAQLRDALKKAPSPAQIPPLARLALQGGTFSPLDATQQLATAKRDLEAGKQHAFYEASMKPFNDLDSQINEWDTGLGYHPNPDITPKPGVPQAVYRNFLYMHMPVKNGQFVDRPAINAASNADKIASLSNPKDKALVDKIYQAKLFTDPYYDEKKEENLTPIDIAKGLASYQGERAKAGFHEAMDKFDQGPLEPVLDKTPVLKDLHAAVHKATDADHEHTAEKYFMQNALSPEDKTSGIVPLLASMQKDYHKSADDHVEYKDPYYDAMHFKSHISNHLLTNSGIEKDVVREGMSMPELVDKYKFWFRPSDVYTIALRQAKLGNPELASQYAAMTTDEKEQLGITPLTHEEREQLQKDVKNFPLIRFKSGQPRRQNMNATLGALAGKYGAEIRIEPDSPLRKEVVQELEDHYKKQGAPFYYGP